MDTPGTDNSRMDGFDALRAATDRNAPLSVVRPDQAGKAPFANGRLLHFRRDCIEIEDVRVIGRDVRLCKGDKLDAYFALDGATFYFPTQILAAASPVRLNQVMVVSGMVLAVPTEVRLGQRRNAFRVSLGAKDQRAYVEAWRPAKWAEDEPMDPEHELTVEEILARPADHKGWIADASDRGLGIVLESVSYTTIKMFEPMLLRLTLPGRADPLIFEIEVRQARQALDHDSRLGCLILMNRPQETISADIRRLRDYLSEVQRNQLKKRQAG